MNAQEILLACLAESLPTIEEVDPSTARMAGEYLVVSGHVAMPLDGVAWSLDRLSDILIKDELDAPLAVLCAVSERDPKPIYELTKYQYTALLADAPDPAALQGAARFSRDYLVIEEHALAGYLEHYATGSALWGGFHHGKSPAESYGDISEIKARRSLVAPTPHHLNSFRLVTKAASPREQYLRIYHTIELLFDYVTYRRFVKAGDDLVGFGKIMSAHQRSELERLKSIIKDFCSDLETVARLMTKLEPFLDRAEEMFQIHTKEGNPLAPDRNGDDKKWTAFRAVVKAGTVDRVEFSNKVAKGENFDEFICKLAAYQIYRIRSSIAHSRIGEYLLSTEDDKMIASFGLPLLTEVATQIFASQPLLDLLPPTT